jgi:cobalt-zinc-cadmium efflux system protein
MAHGHHHSATVSPKVNTVFIVGIALNLAFVIVEATVGFIIHSLSLISDAAHNLADVGTLGLSLLAFKLMNVKATRHFTYGYRKTSILVALFNSSVLLVTIGGIFFEAARKLFHPESMQGSTIAIVAGIGILINGLTAFLFFRNKDKDINIKSAYLHLISDALVSAAIVAGGVIMLFTDWFWIDSILSLLVAIVILFSTWQLLRESLRLSLDGVPDSIHPDEIQAIAMQIEGVKGIHHLHIWALSSTENALTAHLVLQNDATAEQEHHIKHELKHAWEHKNIRHVTIETERENEECKEVVC